MFSNVFKPHNIRMSENIIYTVPRIQGYTINNSTFILDIPVLHQDCPLAIHR